MILGLYIAMLALMLVLIVRLLRLSQQLEGKNKELKEALDAKGEEMRYDRQVLEDTQRLLQMKRRFLNNVSHELRTPLNAIGGFTEVLLSGEHELSANEQQHLRQVIGENVKLLTDIVEKMMQQSYYDSLRQLPRRDMVNPNDLCHELTETYRQRLHRGVELRFTSRLSDDQTLLTNREAMQRLLGHLLDNAVHFTRKGSITVGLLRHPVSQRLVLWVCDTGPGISSERREEVFNLFCETGHEVKTLGMGLSICRSICRLLGGVIYIDPEYTGGTRVIVELPFIEPKNDLD